MRSYVFVKCPLLNSSGAFSVLTGCTTAPMFSHSTVVPGSISSTPGKYHGASSLMTILFCAAHADSSVNSKISIIVFFIFLMNDIIF